MQCHHLEWYTLLKCNKTNRACLGLFPGLQDRRHSLVQIENLMEFYVVGVSLGTAWAHPSSGDTVASVMIGGLKTIQNGAFPIHTNDLICIYFDDERDLFEVLFCVVIWD